MGRTACTEPQCLYKGDLYLTFTLIVLSLDATQGESKFGTQALDGATPVSKNKVENFVQYYVLSSSVFEIHSNFKSGNTLLVRPTVVYYDNAL